MRDKKRIDWMVFALAKAWKKHPDLRLAQLILNLSKEYGEDLYNVEDDELMERLTAMYLK